MKQNSKMPLYGIEQDWLSQEKLGSRQLFRPVVISISIVCFFVSFVVGFFALISLGNNDEQPSIDTLNDEDINYIETIIEACKETHYNRNRWVSSRILSRQSKCADFALSFCRHVVHNHPVDPSARRATVEFICKAAHIAEVGELRYIIHEHYSLDFISIERDVYRLFGFFDFNSEKIKSKTFFELRELAEIMNFFIIDEAAKDNKNVISSDSKFIVLESENQSDIEILWLELSHICEVYSIQQCSNRAEKICNSVREEFSTHSAEQIRIYDIQRSACELNELLAQD